MRPFKTITPETVDRIKRTLKFAGISETARQMNLSTYTVGCVKSGKYDSDKPLQNDRKKMG